MFKRENFFKGNFVNSSNYKKNLIKTNFFFNVLISDLKKNKIPLLESYNKNYDYDFTKKTIKKFSKYQNIIIIGIGGSILGTKSIYSFMEKKIKKNVFFFDTLDPKLNYKYNKIKNLANSCFIVVSKSGNTLETIANLGAIFSQKLLKNKLIIITEMTNNALMDIANKHNAEIIEHKDFIGGRYSVLSETSMFPSALMGLNLLKFKNLKNLLRNKNFVTTLIQNVASIYTLNLKKINNSIILNYDSSLVNLGYWYQQLVAESLGKKGRGINPFLSFAPRDHHSLLQLYLDGPKDKFFTFFNTMNKKDSFKVFPNIIPKNMKFLKNKNLKSIINAQHKATIKIFNSKNIPFREIIFNKTNENQLGAIFTFFVLETILLARLMGVNPYNQPSVEEVKIETKKILK